MGEEWRWSVWNERQSMRDLHSDLKTDLSIDTKMALVWQDAEVDKARIGDWLRCLPCSRPFWLHFQNGTTRGAISDHAQGQIFQLNMSQAMSLG